MSKYFFIRDTLEKEIEINLEDFENSKKEKYNKILDNVSNNTDYEIYNIATVSDKEINRRIYPHEHVLDTVKENLWLKPFNKPLLKNHDEYTEPLGRIIDSFYILHATKSCIAKSGEEDIPDSVINELQSKKMLDVGTGSVILKIQPDSETFNKIKTGIYLTTSQGSVTDSRTCSICGKDIMSCEHMPGRTYDNKKCLIITGKLRPIENSVVNAPANDTSIFIVYNKVTKKIEDSLTVIKDNEELNKIKDQSEVNKNIMNPEKITKMVQVLKDAQLRKVEDFFGKEEKINALFDLFELEDLDKMIQITDTFLEFGQNKINDKITELNKIIADKEESITALNTKIDDLELKLTDLENVEPVVPPVVPEPPVETPVVPEPPVTPEAPVEPPVVPPVVPPATKDNKEEKVKDLEQQEEKTKIGVIDSNFTLHNLNKPEIKNNDSLLENFYANQKNIVNTF